MGKSSDLKLLISNKMRNILLLHIVLTFALEPNFDNCPDKEIGEACIIQCQRDSWKCLIDCDQDPNCQVKCGRDQLDCTYHCPCYVYCLDGCSQCADHPMCNP